MAVKNAADVNGVIVVNPVKTGAIDMFIVGTTPLIFNRMSEKALRDLLLPPKRRGRVELEATQKHDPPSEYRASVHRSNDPTSAAGLVFPATAFKGAISEAALRIPGVTKTEIGQLVWVEGYTVEIFGTPKLFMSAVRNQGMNRTPDIRTRAILPEWACKVTVRFVEPQLTAQTLANLAGAAGVMMGIGDFRQEKGAGNFGAFTLVAREDKTYARIVSTQGRAVQMAALEEPVPFDNDSAELLGWFAEEVGRRRAAGHSSAVRTVKPNGAEATQ